MKNFSSKTRTENLKKLNENEFDLLIIGGGINGAGVARDAALRGFKVALIEAKDFASGTSSKSSKLIHGGIRYLENYDFKLVFEALAERAILFKLAPHLSHPLRFVIPLYKNSRVSLFLMGLGMWLYDLLALFRTPKMHERLSANNIIEKYPIIQAQNLIGGYEYSDGYMDDDRLVHETLRSANEAGAVIVNYTKAMSRIKTASFQTVTCVEGLSNNEVIIKAKHLVCTAGPWTDLVASELIPNWKKILRPTKGIHLTFLKQKINLTSAIVMAAEKSSRIVFAIPRHEMIIIGTTDTDYKESPDQVKVTSEDVKYLLNISNQYFPGAHLTEKDIISSYAGVRPLVHDGSSNEGKTSREHTILHDSSGITLVAGGKYTTYRKMSEEIVDQIGQYFSKDFQHKLKKCETKNAFNHYTTVKNYEKALLETKNNHLNHSLALRYGLEFSEIKNKFSHYQSYWQLEAAQAIHTTMCLNLTDFYIRRVPLFLAYSDHGLSELNSISEVFRNELNLSEPELEKQKNDLLNYIKNEFSWRDTLSN